MDETCVYLDFPSNYTYENESINLKNIIQNNLKKSSLIKKRTKVLAAFSGLASG